MDKSIGKNLIEADERKQPEVNLLLIKMLENNQDKNVR